MTAMQKITKLKPRTSETLDELREEYQKGIVGGMRKLVDEIGPSLFLAARKRWPEAKPIEIVRLDGPTGVGKSYGVKRLFKALGGKPENLLYIDGAAMQERHEASKLFGAPPGYVGYSDEPLLTQKTIQRSIPSASMPSPFILWDEWDKTHEHAKRSLLNGFEEGFLTLGNGQRVSLQGAFVFMTSNLAAQEVQQRTMRFEGGTKGKGELTRALREVESPELRNRFTRTLWIDPLTKEECYEIINLEMLQALRVFKVKCNVRLEESMRQAVVDRGFSPEWGAREIKRILQREVIPALISLEDMADNIRVTATPEGVFEFSELMK